MRQLAVLALAGFREAIRNRVTVVVGVFALALIALTTVVLDLTVLSLDRVVTDFGLGVMSLLMISLAIFMSVGMLNRELERRTVFLLVSRPISRSLFIVARYLGIMVTLTLLLAAMTAVYVAQIFIFDVPTANSVPAAIGGLWCQLLLLSAMGIFFSSMSGQITSAICVVGLFLVGQWTADLHVLAVKLGPVMAAVARAGYYVLPNFARMDFKPQAAAGASVTLDEFLHGLGTSVGWSLLFIVGATLLFRRRDFK
jgi:ABC-type transport system involved in multi-copper enzyme maturation permease subunit